MAEYSRFHKAKWDQPGFAGMSPTALALYFFVRSCRHCNSIGIYRLHRYYALADLPGWTEERLQEGLNELLKNGWIVYDNDSKVILLTDWFEDHNCDNDNQFLRFKADLEKVPDTKLFRELINRLESKPKILKEQYSNQLINLLRERVKEPMRQPLEQPLPDGSTNPITIPSTDSIPNTDTVADSEKTCEIAVFESEIFSKFLEIYHRVCPFGTKVIKFTEARKRHLRARLKEHPDLSWWEDLLKNNVAGSPFLRGETTPSNGHRQFKLDIDFLLGIDTFTKICEGKYVDDHRDGPPGEFSEKTMRTMARMNEILEEDKNDGKRKNAIF